MTGMIMNELPQDKERIFNGGIVFKNSVLLATTRVADIPSLVKLTTKKATNGKVENHEYKSY